MRVAVTGGQGWLGRSVVNALLHQQSAVVLATGRSAPHSSAEPSPRTNYTYVSCDLCQTDRLRHVLNDFKPSHIVHLAGAMPNSSSDEMDRNNVAATLSLVTAAAALQPAPRIIISSSGSIYGEASYLPQDEEHPIEPMTDYARSKWKAEQSAQAIARKLGLQILFARIFNLVGPGTPTSLLPGTLGFQLAAVTVDKRSPVVQMGALTAVRDYIDVRDCAAALVLLCRVDTEWTAVNIGSGVGTRVDQIWATLLAIARKRGCPPVTVEGLREFAPNPSRQIANIARLGHLGFRPAIPLMQSLEDLYETELSMQQEYNPHGSHTAPS